MAISLSDPIHGGFVLSDSERPFFLLLFLTIFLGLFLILFLNIFLDPREEFKTGYVQPLAQSDRSEKLDLIDRLSPPPKILVLGSSSSGKINPSFIYNLTNKSAFNAAVGASATEDYYAELAYLIEDKHMRFETVILGLELFSFNDYLDIHPQLLSEDRLSRKLKDQISVPILSHFAKTISVSYILDDLTVLNYTLFGYPPKSSYNDAFGYTYYDVLDKQKENNSFDLSAHLQETYPSCLTRYASMSKLSKSRKDYLRSFLNLATKNNISVILFHPPYHPECSDILNNQSNYRKLVKEESSYLNSLHKEFNFTYLDYSDIRTYNGYADGFYDHFHGDTNNLNLLTRLLLS